MRTPSAVDPPFPCGALRPASPKRPGRADVREVFRHYKTCRHPGCRKQRRALLIAAGLFLQHVEGIDTTPEQMAAAYDRVQQERSIRCAPRSR